MKNIRAKTLTIKLTNRVTYKLIYEDIQAKHFEKKIRTQISSTIGTKSYKLLSGDELMI